VTAEIRPEDLPNERRTYRCASLLALIGFEAVWTGRHNVFMFRACLDDKHQNGATAIARDRGIPSLHVPLYRDLRDQTGVIWPSLFVRCFERRFQLLERRNIQ
jgi:hypothetical protein